MIINLTDTQIARLLDLCEKIAVLRQRIPKPPFEGVNVSLEVARHLRKDLEAANDVLLELGALLRV